ncbi:MAG: FHA domain-containing protein [Blastocatellia bacterium]
MNCPACKVQNIDGAKFCGACGAALAAGASAAASTGSLTNCPQGHVFSAVYPQCPYCPQPDQRPAADFATRIEPFAETLIESVPTVTGSAVPKPSSATVIEPPSDQGRTGQMRREYATVIEPIGNAAPEPPASPASGMNQTGQMRRDYATVIEPAGNPAPPVISPSDMNQTGQIRRDYATVIEPAGNPAPPVSPAPEMNQTGQIRRDYATVIEPVGYSASASDERTGQLPGAPATQIAPPDPFASPVSRTAVTGPIEAAKPAPPPPRPPILQPVAPAPPPPPRPPILQPVAPTPPPPAAAAKDAKQRRTVVVPADGSTMSAARLVGWLVTFSRNQDGVDFRVRAGRNVLGANPSCDIVVDDEATSGVHASIVYRNGRCYLKDELSSNGTWLNGVEVNEPEQLQSYDQIRVGNTLLTWVALEVGP